MYVYNSNVKVLQTQRYVATDRDHRRESCRRRGTCQRTGITDVRNFFLAGTTALLRLHGVPRDGGLRCQRLEGAAGSSRLEPDGMCRYSYVYTGRASLQGLHRYLGRRHVKREARQTRRDT